MSDRLTPEELAEIRARCEAATPGPWVMCSCGKCGQVWGEHGAWTAATVTDYEAEKPREQVDADGAFIAAARTDVPRLLAEVEALRVLAVELAVVAEEAGPCWDAQGASRCYAHGGSDWPCLTGLAIAKAREMGLLP